MAAPQPSDNVYVGDLPGTMDKQTLDTIFGAYGVISDSKVLPPKGGQTAACALIRFGSVDIATWIVENLNGNIPEGLESAIQVRFANAPGTIKGKGGGDARWQPYGKGGDNMWGGKGDDNMWGKGKGGDNMWGKGKGGDNTWGGKGDDNMWGKGGDNAWGKGGDNMWGKGAKGSKSGKGDAPASVEMVLKGAGKGGILPTGQVSEECQIYVKSLPADTTDLSLYQLFSAFGPIAPRGVKAMQNPDGSCKGFGFVDYLDPACATAAVMAFSDFKLPDGTAIQVSQKKPGRKAQGKGEN
eukprot:TRINITY_DN56710_c0_g1_i1.p1 TRINITY_DN56710_c0_g1~~TRINITY_DN56710_c0_g1_i1.p1  ORF type:complete len:297 (-),score=59.66 TRINITY_DN56710_c0_g1_i1:97-987(-)